MFQKEKEEFEEEKDELEEEKKLLQKEELEAERERIEKERIEKEKLKREKEELEKEKEKLQREKEAQKQREKERVKEEYSDKYYENRYHGNEKAKMYQRNLENNMILNLRKNVTKTIQPEQSKLLMKKNMNTNEHKPNSYQAQRNKRTTENIDNRLRTLRPIGLVDIDSVSSLNTSSSSIMLNKTVDNKLENKHDINNENKNIPNRNKQDINNENKNIPNRNKQYIDNENGNIPNQNNENREKPSNKEDKYYQMLRHINSEENNKLMNEIFSGQPSFNPNNDSDSLNPNYNNNQMINEPTDNNNNNNNNNNTNGDKSSSLQNEIAKIIDDNNNIGREIYKMNEENKKLINLLQCLNTSSNIFAEKKKNLENYIISQSSLLNDAKKMFIEEYYKAKDMEQEIDNLKSNNSHMKKKLDECRDNEFKMKLQSSKERYLLNNFVDTKQPFNFPSTVDLPKFYTDAPKF
ncbi:hypothetical protein H8356DRAFT_926607 [Neocallimastix lanati (nom. inval.)]|uniref:Uncharacterized protein n=1 Tax=Neocallimastix californiae TaxID=1754190 RepID=A0A1Y2F9K6_9FUNG|nr:hypothetical protein H8356DRAFT_926607 [Neocallimastix sp. JGI-2020a]ORY80124.1 hypothetical protein LY90DRAFT_664574 [Neocallimastix californiae]|eukprot:ORY80124.1 hypothetical protein LY90DRAFT_664574 [Neocallimastix californiae]